MNYFLQFHDANGVLNEIEVQLMYQSVTAMTEVQRQGSVYVAVFASPFGPLSIVLPNGYAATQPWTWIGVRAA